MRGLLPRAIGPLGPPRRVLLLLLLLIPPALAVTPDRDAEFDPNRHAAHKAVKVGGPQPPVDHAGVAAAAALNQTVRAVPGKKVTGTPPAAAQKKSPAEEKARADAEKESMRKAFQQKGDKHLPTVDKHKGLPAIPQVKSLDPIPANQGIIRLKPGALTPQLRKNQLTIVKFVVEGAVPYQKKLRDSFDEMAKRYQGRALFIEVNAKHEKDFAHMTKFTYHGTPSLVAMRMGEIQDIIGPITEQKIRNIEWFVRSAIDANEADVITKAASVADAHAFVAQYAHRPIVIGHFAKFKTFRDAFERSAIALRNDVAVRCLFLEVESPDVLLAAAHPTKIDLDDQNAFLFVKYPESNGSHAVVHFSPSFENPLEIPSFIVSHVSPLVTELTKANARYFGTTHPILALIQKDTTDANRFRVLRHLAADYRGHFDFAYADFEQSQFFKHVGDQKKGVDAGFAIVGFEDGRFQKHVYSGEMKFEKVKEWVQFYLDGSMEGKIPKTPQKEIDSQTGESFHTSLHAIRGDQWIANVMDGSKDVVVYQYTADCVPCRNFQFVVNNVANYLSHVPSLKLVKINLSNESPPDRNRATHVPSLTLYPANQKDKPVVFLGVGNKPRILRWIKQFAFIKFRARNRDTEVFYARILVFMAGWVFLLGFTMRKARKYNIQIGDFTSGRKLRTRK